MQLLALKMKEAAESQEMCASFRSWKRPGNEFSPEPSEKNAALLMPSF